ncbi:hypothetical protein HK104_000227 [Borealophlyctis nickersoniae]|nr:hypothetical protein HK104_000227 [Borealophlyctis nickersoniae]
MSSTKNMVEETFEWTIKDYKRACIQDVDELGTLESPIFGPPEQPWRLKLRTKPIGEQYAAHLGLFLVALPTSQEKEAKSWTRRLRFQIHAQKRDGTVFLFNNGDNDHVFDENTRPFGQSKAMKRDTFAQRYLQSAGSLVLMCKLKYERLPQPRFPRSPLSHRELLFSEHLSDIKIKTADGISIPAHKTLLCNAGFFRSYMKFNNTAYNTRSAAGETVTTDFSSAAIRSMLEFLYTDTLTTHTPQTAAERRDLIRLADMYQLPSLHALIAESIVAQDLTTEAARDLLEFAHLHGQSAGCGFLRDACVGVVRSECGLLDKGFGEWIASLDPDLVKILYANEGANAGKDEVGKEQS